MDDKGERQTSYAIMDMNPQTGVFEVRVCFSSKVQDKCCIVIKLLAVCLLLWLSLSEYSPPSRILPCC